MCAAGKKTDQRTTATRVGGRTKMIVNLNVKKKNVFFVFGYRGNATRLKLQNIDGHGKFRGCIEVGKCYPLNRISVKRNISNICATLSNGPITANYKLSTFVRYSVARRYSIVGSVLNLGNTITA